MISPNRQAPKYKPLKDQDIRWPTFNGGLVTFFKPTELQPNELAQADNIMYVGKGVPTGRWGTAPYYQTGEGGSTRLLDAYYNSTASLNQLLAITDSGYLTVKNGASYKIVTGASFLSGQNYQSAQLSNFTYISAASLPFVKFNGSILIPYTALNQPTNVSVALISPASGFTTYSWVITATSQTGETNYTGVENKTLASLPLSLASLQIKVSWNTVSAVASTVTGYNVYRGFPGQETLLVSTGPDTTQIIDTGTQAALSIFPPTSNTTSGPMAKYILKFGQRLILAGIAGDPDKVYVSGPYPYHDRFSAVDGGAYFYVSPNDGDFITGLQITGNQFIGGSGVEANLLVFKNNAVYRVSFSNITLGVQSILNADVQVLTTSSGSSSGDTTILVENDTYYFGRKGLYVVGMQQSYLNQIRTNELSFRVRDYVRTSLSDDDYRRANAGYLDNKYLISFPGEAQVLMYDRERNAFALWKTPWGVTKWLRYFDSSNNETWLAGTDSTGPTAKPMVQQFSPSFISDNGTAIAKTILTRKEDMGNWSVFKVLKLFYVLFRNVRGTVFVDLRIEDKTGDTVQVKSFAVGGILGSGGWGNDQWGSQEWGQTNAKVVLTGDELARYSNIFKNVRVAQVSVSTVDANANFEFLQVRMTAQGLGDQSLPAADKV